MPNDYKIIEKDDKKYVTMLVRIDVGEVSSDILDVNRINQIKDSIIYQISNLLSENRDSQIPLNKLVELMDYYANAKLIQDSGVQHLPIVQDINGKLHGFKDGIEENVEMDLIIAKKYLDACKKHEDSWNEENKEYESQPHYNIFLESLTEEEKNSGFATMLFNFGHRWNDTICICENILKLKGETYDFNKARTM